MGHLERLRRVARARGSVVRDLADARGGDGEELRGGGLVVRHADALLVQGVEIRRGGARRVTVPAVPDRALLAVQDVQRLRQIARGAVVLLGLALVVERAAGARRLLVGGVHKSRRLAGRVGVPARLVHKVCPHCLARLDSALALAASGARG